ncbi:hypothetical protein C8R44DRAFT_727978 [Mycena epipterygia]|nr:hypothetical protein C8R44DRAFT_727978 [Mycena epipterygia]
MCCVWLADALLNAGFIRAGSYGHESVNGAGARYSNLPGDCCQCSIMVGDYSAARSYTAESTIDANRNSRVKGETLRVTKAAYLLADHVEMYHVEMRVEYSCRGYWVSFAALQTDQVRRTPFATDVRTRGIQGNRITPVPDALVHDAPLRTYLHVTGSCPPPVPPVRHEYGVASKGLSAGPKLEAGVSVFLTQVGQPRTLLFNCALKNQHIDFGIVCLVNASSSCAESTVLRIRITSTTAPANGGAGSLLAGYGLSEDVSWGFTGTILGVYATGNGRNASTPAYVSRWEYEGIRQVTNNED